MRRSILFSCIFFLLLGNLHFIFAQGMGLEQIFETEIKADSDSAPIEFCYKISSNTDGIDMELLLGACGQSSSFNEYYKIPPGNPDEAEIPWDFYFTDASATKRYVLFSESGSGTEFSWSLKLTKTCTLRFTRLHGNVSDAGTLVLFQGESGSWEIIDSSHTFTQLAAGDYTIIFTPHKNVETSSILTLQPGWNLLHLPLVARDKIDDWQDFLQLPRYSLSGKAFVRSSAQGDPPRPGQAFWIFNSGIGEHTVKLDGYVPHAHEWAELKPGWNFTGGEQFEGSVQIWRDARYQDADSVDEQSSGYWKYK